MVVSRLIEHSALSQFEVFSDSDIAREAYSFSETLVNTSGRCLFNKLLAIITHKTSCSLTTKTPMKISINSDAFPAFSVFVSDLDNAQEAVKAIALMDKNGKKLLDFPLVKMASDNLENATKAIATAPKQVNRKAEIETNYKIARAMFVNAIDSNQKGIDLQRFES